MDEDQGQYEDEKDAQAAYDADMNARGDYEAKMAEAESLEAEAEANNMTHSQENKTLKMRLWNRFNKKLNESGNPEVWIEEFDSIIDEVTASAHAKGVSEGQKKTAIQIVKDIDKMYPRLRGRDMTDENIRMKITREAGAVSAITWGIMKGWGLEPEDLTHPHNEEEHDSR